MNIVAIGGGEKRLPLEHALELTGDQAPHVLLVASAASTQASYDRKVPAITNYFANLGATTSVLHEYAVNPSPTRIDHEIGRASMIYTIGGNSPYMIETMGRHGTDKKLKHALQTGKVHAGTSAGALLPFELAHSNVAKRPAEEDWDYEFLETLGVVPGVATAHANQRDPTPRGIRKDTRLEALVANFPKSMELGYAIDNHAAIIFGANGLATVIRSQPGSNGHIIRRDKNGKLQTNVLE